MLFAQQQLNHNYDDYNYRRAHLHNYIFQIKKPCTYDYGHPLFVKWDRGRSMIAYDVDFSQFVVLHNGRNYKEYDKK